MTTPSDDHAARRDECPGCLGDGTLIEHGKDGPCPVCDGDGTVTHAAREAEIRQRIAVEVKREISRMNAFWGPQVPRDFRWGYERGMYCVLGIIERGAQPEGEQT